MGVFRHCRYTCGCQPRCYNCLYGALYHDHLVDIQNRLAHQKLTGSRFSEEKTIGILNVLQAELNAQKLGRKHGVGNATF